MKEKSIVGISNPKKLSNENSNLHNNFHVMEQIQLNLFDKQTRNVFLHVQRIQASQQIQFIKSFSVWWRLAIDEGKFC